MACVNLVRVILNKYFWDCPCMLKDRCQDSKILDDLDRAGPVLRQMKPWHL